MNENVLTLADLLAEFGQIIEQFDGEELFEKVNEFFDRADRKLGGGDER
jgi:predicted HAD superfamily phosphohydrolase